MLILRTISRYGTELAGLDTNIIFNQINIFNFQILINREYLKETTIFGFHFLINETQFFISEH